MQNFKYPYFSRDIAEFWRRWHISLTTWFRDYIYIPLGGSRAGKWKSFRNTLVIFLVSGFWHGANWTFVAWGAYHALLFLPLLLLGQNRRYRDSVAENSFLPSVKELTQMELRFCWSYWDGFCSGRKIYPKRLCISSGCSMSRYSRLLSLWAWDSGNSC